MKETSMYPPFERVGQEDDQAETHIGLVQSTVHYPYDGELCNLRLLCGQVCTNGRRVIW